MGSRKSQPLSSSALNLFILQTTPGRRWGVGFLIGAGLLGLLLGITHASNVVNIVVLVVYTWTALALVFHMAARYWQGLAVMNDEPAENEGDEDAQPG